MRLLDLFCGAGGAAVGYHLAGFDVVGVDKDPQPNYPFDFHQGDALDYPLDGFDAIHASPPCQAYSDLAKRNGNAHQYPKLIPPMQRRLRASGLPYVIENVEGAPLDDYVLLCGTMFPELRVIRHRLFECSFPLPVTPPGVGHPEHPIIFTFDKRKKQYGKLDQNDPSVFVSVTGGGNSTVAKAKTAMGIDWKITKEEINEAIPPAYTRYIGAWLLKNGSQQRESQPSLW